MLNSFKNHHLATMIDTERHKEFMKEALPHLIGGLITGIFLYIVFLDFTSFSGRVLWLAAQALLLTSTLIFYSIYYFSPKKLSLKQWEKVIIFVSLLWGCVWTLPPHVLLLTNDSQYVAALLVITVALAITPAPAMVQYPLGYFAFMTLPLLSIFIKLLTLDLNILLVLFVPFFWLTVLAYGWRLHQTIIDSIRLRLEVDESRKSAETANISKSKFLAAASHDLRQPLQAISLFISALKEKLVISDQSNVSINETEPLIQRLESSIDSMSELLNSLLDVSKLDANVIQPKLQHVNIEQLLKKSIAEHDILAREKNLKLKVEITPNAIFVDPVLLERIVGNLLNNAIRYTEQGSIILSSTLKDGEVNISISDTGIGIPKNEQMAIFTDFYQLNNPERNQKKGLGLGLTIVKRLCDLQGWNISLSSTEYQGSNFSITVPLGEPNKVIQNTASGSDFVVFNNEDIVIIENDDNIRVGLEKLLTGWNCKILSFSTSKDCLEFFNTNSLIPHLIISDFRLQNNDTGLELIKLIRKQKKCDIPAIIITGDTAPERLKEAQESGLKIIHKPIKAAILRRIIKQALTL